MFNLSVCVCVCVFILVFHTINRFFETYLHIPTSKSDGPPPMFIFFCCVFFFFVFVCARLVLNDRLGLPCHCSRYPHRNVLGATWAEGDVPSAHGLVVGTGRNSYVGGRKWYC